MRVCQPLRAGVVEVGQRARFQLLRGRLVLGQGVVGIAGNHPGHARDQVGGAEPIRAQLVQSRGGDSLGARVGGEIAKRPC